LAKDGVLESQDFFVAGTWGDDAGAAACAPNPIPLELEPAIFGERFIRDLFAVVDAAGDNACEDDIDSDSLDGTVGRHSKCHEVEV
jgi:hypothetical protein